MGKSQEKTELDGGELRVVELTGEPGDAVFYHRALVFGGVARNVTDTPVCLCVDEGGTFRL